MNFDRSAITWLSDTVHSVYSARTIGELAQAALVAVNRRFNLPISAVEELSHSGSGYMVHGIANSVPVPENHVAYLHDHPMLPLVHDLPTLAHVRGRVSRWALEKTDYFNGIARPMGYNDHVILRAQRAPSAVTVSLCRDKLFTPAECGMLELFQPHLTAAWARVAEPERAVGLMGAQGLRLAVDLRPSGLGPAQYARLRSYFPSWRDSGRLPARLHDWVVATREELSRGAFARPLRVLAVEALHGTLLVRYLPDATGGGELRLMEKPSGLNRFPRNLDLSVREREVLHWIVQGKRDAEIGVILGLSPKTVGKHVEHVLAKLHVGNRTAAVAVVQST